MQSMVDQCSSLNFCCGRLSIVSSPPLPSTILDSLIHRFHSEQSERMTPINNSVVSRNVKGCLPSHLYCNHFHLHVTLLLFLCSLLLIVHVSSASNSFLVSQKMEKGQLSMFTMLRENLWHSFRILTVWLLDQ
jgi:hypothetical protein